MGSIIKPKQSVSIAHTAARYGNEIIKKLDFETDKIKTQRLRVRGKLIDSTTICGAAPGQSSCYNLLSQSYTCISSSSICCGDGQSCPLGQSCEKTKGCVNVTEAYATCPPQ